MRGGRFLLGAALGGAGGIAGGVAVVSCVLYGLPFLAVMEIVLAASSDDQGSPGKAFVGDAE